MRPQTKNNYIAAKIALLTGCRKIVILNEVKDLKTA